MVIDFVFSKEFEPWNNIDVQIGDRIERVSLTSVSRTIKRLELKETKEIVHCIKSNIWEHGISEILFSMDGTFNNVFSFDRLPISFKASVSPNSKKKTIHVLDKEFLSSDEKTQKKWCIAGTVQIFVYCLILFFLTIVFSSVFKECWMFISIFGLLTCSFITFICVKKVQRTLKLIKDNSKLP